MWWRLPKRSPAHGARGWDIHQDTIHWRMQHQGSDRFCRRSLRLKIPNGGSMRKQSQGRCPEDLREVACGQIEHGSLMIRPIVEVPRDICHRFSLMIESFEGRGELLDRGRRHGSPPCSVNLAHRRRRILNPRSFIDTFCLGRGVLKMMSRAVRRRLAALRSFDGMQHTRPGLSNPSNCRAPGLSSAKSRRPRRGIRT